MDYSRGEVEVEARASASVRPRGVTEGCYAAAAGVAGRGEGKAATERCLDESDEKISCFSRFFSAEPGTNKWRLVVDFRWLNQWCVKNRVKMETLKKLRRLAKPGDWCFSFDLQDGFHALGIHPDFQRFMQFDLQGDLLQCSAMPFGWSDAPRVFCKFYDSDGQSVAGPVVLAGTRTVTAECEYYRAWTIFWCWSTLSEKAFCVEKKFNWRLASFTGLCQSVYLAVPAARLYLRELYFVLAEKRSWGAKGGGDRVVKSGDTGQRSKHIQQVAVELL
ncbi:hypothetical protein CYMTET_30444 [Cymbomonas tetramitiformis]|uniref:Reverse transcriptase domain-containing protein n=1 Tax=Cymbomonas tetramitiformis TaxID=36881 RepID=A0AAE0KU48_9CHLO|nr:hypothetical protein CYMTET_30444 [Cymbomonas tetramitiformis]